MDKWIENLRKNSTWDKIKKIALGILHGIQALHSKGVFHRDIKPENIMIRSEIPIVMDIGIAEVTSANDHTLHTQLKDFLGSVRYASPQFILGEQFSSSDDIYSIGCTFLQLFSGQKPYAEIERKPVLPIAVIQSPPVIPTFRENIPQGIRVLVEGCLNKERDRRPTLDNLLEAIENDGESDFIRQEIKYQQTAARGYQILSVDTKSGSFYADMRGQHESVGLEYSVVREEPAIFVPSLGTEVRPETKIATAELKHIHQNVGHFKIRGNDGCPLKE